MLTWRRQSAWPFRGERRSTPIWACPCAGTGSSRICSVRRFGISLRPRWCGRRTARPRRTCSRARPRRLHLLPICVTRLSGRRILCEVPGRRGDRLWRSERCVGDLFPTCRIAWQDAGMRLRHEWGRGMRCRICKSPVGLHRSTAVKESVSAKVFSL